MANRNQMVILAHLAKKSAKMSFITASARSFTALDPMVHAVELVATQDCRVEWVHDATNTADATGSPGVTGETVGLSRMIRAGGIYYLPVDVAGSTGPVLSVIGVTAAGVLELTPLTE